MESLSNFPKTASASELILVFLTFIVLPLWTIRNGVVFFKKSDISLDYTSLSPSEIRDRVNRNMKSRKMSDVPVPFPNCWYVALESVEVKSGQAKNATVAGQEIVIWREENGSQLYASDAYCPHLGAHMGFGGKVIKDCIQCPFHYWSYTGKQMGKLMSTPFLKNGPEKLHLRMWDVVEVYGLIFVWYHVKGDGPTYEITTSPSLLPNGYYCKGRIDIKLPTVFQDVAENGMDTTHLRTLHSFFQTPESYPDSWNGIIRDDHKIEWTNNLKKGEDGMEMRHIFETTIKQSFRIFDKFNILDSVYISKNIGPTFCRSILETAFGKLYITIAVTAVEKNVTRLLTRFYTPWYIPQPFTNFIISLFASQSKKDANIWSSKAYMKNPMLAKDEKALAYFKRYMKQFYTLEKHDRVCNGDLNF